MNKSLSTLLNDFEWIHSHTINGHNITDISIDSRLSKKGDLFVANPCKTVRENVLDAYKKGVRVFLLDKNSADLQNDIPDSFCYITDNTKKDTALLCSSIYKKKPEIIACVTGTNGKSSTVSLLRQIWELNGIEAASIGTLGIERSFGVDKSLPIPSLTSLDSVSFHKALSYLSQEGVKAVACEASSHGLHQFRLDGVDVSVAGFTNLTQDHLDYHKTMNAYFDAKSLLFSRILNQQKPAVLNADSAYFEDLKKIAENKNQNIITYGKNESCHFRITDVKIQDGLYRLNLCFLGHVVQNIDFPLFGNFQLENLLCASAMAFSTGIAVQDIIDTIPHLKSIKGRMEFIGKSKTGGLIFVDYAHTPDALERILKSIKSHKPNKIHLVFGCGGNRDVTKRPIMGSIANQLADKIYITDDNPRFEDARTIRSQILITCSKGIEIADRAEAIKTSIEYIKENDILIIAGKGHEEGQILSDKTHPFSDQEEVMKWIKI